MFLPQPRHPQKAPEVHSGVAQQFATLIELKINDLDDTIHRNRNPTSSMLYIPLLYHCALAKLIVNFRKFVVPLRILHDISEKNASTKWYSMRINSTSPSGGRVCT